MDKEEYQLKEMLTKQSMEKIPFSTDELAGYVSIIKLFRKEHPYELNSELRNVVDNLPSKHMLMNEMNSHDLKFLFKTVSFLWKKITGGRLSEQERVVYNDEMAKTLDGCYWLLPEEILVAGFNHYDAAKKHKGIICSLLNINPILFEKSLASTPEEVIKTMMKNHATRVIIDRDKSTVYMQCSEKGWPLARTKIKKMYHKHKILRVLDKSKEYSGWGSGVPLIMH
jgi:hypothetical protein